MDRPDAEEAIGVLLHLGLDLDRREIIRVGDEAEITGRDERDGGGEVDLLADVVGADDLDVAGELGLGKTVDGDRAGHGRIHIAQREERKVCGR